MLFIWSPEFEEEANDEELQDDGGENGQELRGESDGDSYDENILNDPWKHQNNSKEESKEGEENLDTGMVHNDEGEHAEDDLGRKLAEMVRNYSTGPDDVDRLRRMATDCSVDAFRKIVMGIFGSIPGDAYDIVITSDRRGMSRLMQSSMSTGYTLRNAEFRMVMNESMNPDVGKRKGCEGEGMFDLFSSEPDYMLSVPRRGKVDTRALEGIVRWWDSEKEVKREMDGIDYVRKLEAENELLRERLAAVQTHDANNNKLLDFMRTLSPEKISSIQAILSSDSLAAFKVIITSVLGDMNSKKVQMTYSTSRDYLAQLQFWCLLVGYSIRNFEKRLEMTKIFETTQEFAEPSLRDLDL